MKDLLEILEKANGLSAPTLFLLAVFAFLYLGFIWWKTFLSSSAIAENEKRKLEVIKLSLEIEELRKKLNPEDAELTKEYSLQATLDTLREAKRQGLRTRFEKFIHHPLKSISGIFQRPRWLRASLVGFGCASLYPIVLMSYNLLNQPNDKLSGAGTIVVWFLLGYWLFTAVVGAITAVLISREDALGAAIFSCGVSILAFHSIVALTQVTLKLVLIFQKVH